MATLDYALLAEYARVDPAGLLTVVGGSFDRVSSPNEIAAHQVHVAMRVLLGGDEESVPVDVRVVAPDGRYELGMSIAAERNPHAQLVDGLTNVVLTVGILAPLPVSGRYLVRVLLDGETAKELPFVVELGAPMQP